MSTITAHVLDMSRGRPAAGLSVLLEREDDGHTWTTLGAGETNSDGRLFGLLPEGEALTAGVYRLTFQTGTWFEGHGLESFHPRVMVEFRVRATGEHFHVPLLLSPFGYTTYRGS